MIYFTADLHLNHENIIKYCNRPFNDLEDMNETLIENWNTIIKHCDTVYIVGDFSFNGKFNGFLYGNKVFLKGNHDKKSDINIKNLVIKKNKKEIFLTHRPQDIVFGYDLYLVGHVHEKWKHKIVNDGYKNNLLINVGVDVWDFKPINFNDICGYINKNKLMEI